MTRIYRQVVKLGGSLLDYEALTAQLRLWLSRQPRSHQVLIVGGGPLADQVRREFESGQFTQDEAHERAVACMSANTRQIAKLLPEVRPESEYDRLLTRLAIPGVTLFDVPAYLSDDEPKLPGKKLPRTWAATSDSIAARLAITIGADQLTLLKSALPKATLPSRIDSTEELSALAAEGYLDQFLPELKDELPRMELVNLRDALTPASALSAMP